MSTRKWGKRFLRLAREISSWSKDPSTKCGAVISDGKFIVGSGYNGFPKRINDNKEDYENREIKYQRVIHAEVNAVLNSRQSLEGCTLHVWPLPPCEVCANIILQVGIQKVLTMRPNEEQLTRWVVKIGIAFDTFTRAGIHVIYYDEEELDG